MSLKSGESHDGDGQNQAQSCRHIQAVGGADTLDKVGLLKLDGVDGSAVKTTYTIWVDSTGDVRILAGEPTDAELLGATTAIGAVIGGQS